MDDEVEEEEREAEEVLGVAFEAGAKSGAGAAVMKGVAATGTRSTTR